jgi:hypothetical protein
MPSPSIKLSSWDGLNYLAYIDLIRMQCEVLLFEFALDFMGAVDAFQSGGRNEEFGEDLDNQNSGGSFNLLGMADGPGPILELKDKKIKNGQLGMDFLFSYHVQGSVTEAGPV